VVGDQVSLEQLNAPVEVNALIRDFLAQTVAPEDRSVWEFVCECGQPGCREHVTLTLALYDQAQHEREPLVARGHLRARARAARRWSAALRAEAQALRNQARHQIKRPEGLARSRPMRHYTLVVTGESGDRLGRSFEGMTVTRDDGRTVIAGFDRDQAHLRGLLQKVTDLGLTLVSVTASSDLSPVTPLR
jgi:hypothetical protein